MTGGGRFLLTGIAYDLGNGIEVHRLPSSLDVDRFHKVISSGAVGDLYYLYKEPDSLTPESLRIISLKNL